jgi:hypothetical protein
MRSVTIQPIGPREDDDEDFHDATRKIYR